MAQRMNKAILMAFGNRLRELRKQRGFSQEELAELSQLDRTYISGIERGTRNVSLSNISVIAKSLDVTVADLVRDL